jgi:site-specific DNA-cytosine methylase
MQSLLTDYREIRHAHFFAGLGGGAKGFNKGTARVGNMVAQFRCLGGIDNNAAAVRDFKRLTGVAGTLLDLFDYEQYRAFHGSEPPTGWREANVEDVRKAFNYENPHIIFLSPPCKGFSGLLSEKLSKSVKYQALNRLVTRGLFLALEAYQDDLPELILLENVPRIVSRGSWLIDQITALMNRYGYAVAPTAHDCGELGWLAQSRKRFLLIARNVAKVPAFLYEPEKKPLRSVGEVLSRAPLPGDPKAGPMHRLPMLTWKTWVRLAFVEAGGDWRSLNKLNVVNGKVADYALVREPQRNDFLGVVDWNQPAGTVTGDARPSKGRFAVADPRAPFTRSGNLGVAKWDSSMGTVQGESLPSNGAFCVADPRTGYSDSQHGILHVADWQNPARTVTGADHITGGALSVADPRPGWENRYGNLSVQSWEEPSKTVIAGGKGVQGGWLSVADPRFKGEAFGQYGVREWDKPAATVTSQRAPGQGPISIADPRRPAGPGGANFNNVFRIVKWEDTSPAITAGGGPTAGGICVGDPRGEYGADTHKNVFRLVRWDEASQTIGSGHGPSSGGMSVADPRFENTQGSYSGKYAVQDWNGPTTTIIGSDRVGSGALCIADPRLAAQKLLSDQYLTNGNCGVVGLDEAPGAVSAAAGCDNEQWGVSDPRGIDGIDPGFAYDYDFRLPEPNEKCNVVIIARDGTFHRPFTTAELAILQSLMDPEDIFDLDGVSDSAKRERIGNAVPPDTAQAIASTMGQTLLLAWSGTTFALSATPIWVRPVAAALAVKPQFEPHE